MPMPRLILPEATYFLTCTTYERKEWFANSDFARILVELLRIYEREYQFTLHAYCVMPEHYHVVLEVGRNKTVSQILHAVNSYSVTRISRKLGLDRKAKIWGERAWDELIRNEDMYWQKVAYILFNPWRAGLVKDPLDGYPFSDIGEWLDRSGKEFLLDLFSKYRRWYE